MYSILQNNHIYYFFLLYLITYTLELFLLIADMFNIGAITYENGNGYY